MLDGSILFWPDWSGGVHQLLVPQLSVTAWKTAHQALDLRMGFFILLHRLNLPATELCPTAMDLDLKTDFLSL